MEPIPDCVVHHPRINEAVQIIKDAATEVGVKGYRSSERGGTLKAEGELRYIQLSYDKTSDRVR